MQIKVVAHPRSKIARIKVNEHSQFDIYVNEPALDGKANAAITKALAEHFKTSKSKVVLIRGQKAKIKVFEIKNEKV